MDELWEAEFRGFFFGEGYIGMNKVKPRQGVNAYRAVAQINIRADDAAVLYDIQRHLGGSVHNRIRPGTPFAKYVSHPSIEWSVTNRDELRRVVAILLRGQLPSKKRHVVELFAEAIELMKSRGGRYTMEERIHLDELVQAMKAAREYVPQEGQVISA